MRFLKLFSTPHVSGTALMRSFGGPGQNTLIYYYSKFTFTPTTLAAAGTHIKEGPLLFGEAILNPKSTQGDPYG